jgi:hypothetical protein
VANIVYKEWLPDQPELGNPGLIRAQNVVPGINGYEPFHPLVANLGSITASSNISGAFMALGSTTISPLAELNVAAGLTLWRAEDAFGSFTFNTAGSRTNSASISDQFAQFENLVIIAGDSNKPYMRTIGSSSNFTSLGVSGTNNSARAIGVINQFVVIGNMNATANAATSGAHKSEYLLRWSGIDQPTSWPLANSATATAQQSGEEYMPSRFGPIYAIYGGDQYGIILQQSGISRMTYVGPPVVFQFDEIDPTHGSYYPRGSVQVGRYVYFVASNGFYRTDGVAVENIGNGKVNKFFANEQDPFDSFDFSCGYDSQNDLVYFAYSTSGATNYLDTLLIYSPVSNNWSRASQNVDILVSQVRSEGDPRSPLLGFDNSIPRNVGRFNGTAGTAVLETGEFEFNEAGRTYADEFKPLVESSGTAPAITVRVGYRDDLGTAPSYTSATTPHSRTKVANVRVDAKYMRLETQIVGEFEKVTGIQFNASPSGSQ